jgi:hypothetical protein
VLLFALTKYRNEVSGTQLASYLGLDIINNVFEARDSLDRITHAFRIGNDNWCDCLVRNDFDFSHDSWVRHNILTPFALQAYERCLTEQVQFCEERAKNSKINMYARQLTSARKRQSSFTGNDRYSVLKTSSSSRAPTTLISSETTFPIAAASMTSDVVPNTPTAGEVVTPISTSSSGRVLRRPTLYKDTRR